jgi:hypothetical protein
VNLAHPAKHPPVYRCNAQAAVLLAEDVQNSDWQLFTYYLIFIHLPNEDCFAGLPGPFRWTNAPHIDECPPSRLKRGAVSDRLFVWHVTVHPRFVHHGSSMCSLVS